MRHPCGQETLVGCLKRNSQALKAVTEHNYKSNLVNYNMTNSNSASYKKRFDYQLRVRTIGMLARNVKVLMVGATDVVAQVSHSSLGHIAV